MHELHCICCTVTIYFFQLLSNMPRGRILVVSLWYAVLLHLRLTLCEPCQNELTACQSVPACQASLACLAGCGLPSSSVRYQLCSRTCNVVSAPIEELKAYKECAAK